jgi:hypothetical protein
MAATSTGIVGIWRRPRVRAAAGIATVVFTSWCLVRTLAREPPETGKSSSGDASRHLTGTVVGARGPLADATVRWQGNEGSVRTDAHGRFSLPRPATARRITASAPGHYVGSQAVEDGPAFIVLEPIPMRDTEDYEWVDPSPQSVSRHRCSLCHERIYGEWRSSAHALAASNPRLLSLIEGTADDGTPQPGPSLRRDHPHGVAVCNACHAPTLEVSDPHWESLAARKASALNGVHCDFCHKVQAVDTSGIGLTHGRYAVRLLRPDARRQVVFGPHDDANRGDSVASPWYRSSEYCATCHEGTVFGVKAYSTFSEWRESPAAARGVQCQACHMAAAADVTNMAPGHGGIPRPSSSLSDHSLRGPASRTYENSLSVSLAITRGERRVRVQVSIDASLVGHGVPTGFIDKHLILVVEAFDENGCSVPQVDGPRIPEYAGESVAGRAGGLFGRVLTGSQGERPEVFWNSVVQDQDTRILPTAPRTVDVAFDVAAERLRIRLLHRRAWERTRLAKHWADDTTTLIDHRCTADDGTADLLTPDRPPGWATAIQEPRDARDD